jgi:hypothetical protein
MQRSAIVGWSDMDISAPIRVICSIRVKNPFQPPPAFMRLSRHFWLETRAHQGHLRTGHFQKPTHYHSRESANPSHALHGFPLARE